VLYHLIYPLHTVYSFLNVFRYITFRTIYATLTALVISFIIGPWLIKKLTDFQMRQSIREDVPRSHLTKEGTPTMGGTLILFALIAPTLLWADLTNRYVWLVLLTTVGFSLVGFFDDLKKVKDRDGMGIKARYKFPLQIGIALATTGILYITLDFNTQLWVPFLKRTTPDLGWLYIPFGVLVIVGTSNAVNLTDGLDGLAIGPVMVSGATFLLFCYLSGHYKFAHYLQIAFIRGSGELTIFCGGLVGAGLGFLWFNTYPAQVFMGDTGSLALGAALGTLALVTKHEIPLAIVGGIFVLETVSVIMQVVSFRLRKRRIFRMAPLHHHFELKGWVEPKVIVRFWIIAIILGLVAISTLKLR